MVFVPTTHTAVEANVSPRARDLARNLEQAVSEFRSRNPGLSDQEIRQALILMSRSRSPAARPLLAGLLAAGLAMGIAVAYMASGAGEGSGAGVQWVAITIGLIAAVLGVLVAVRGRGPS